MFVFPTCWYRGTFDLGRFSCLKTLTEIHDLLLRMISESAPTNLLCLLESEIFRQTDAPTVRHLAPPPRSPWGLTFWETLGAVDNLAHTTPTNFLEESGYTNGKSQRRIPQACCARVFDPQQGSGVNCNELWRPSSWAGHQICCLSLLSCRGRSVERNCTVPCHT